MLLDRKRIKKWAKWVALFLAIIFGVSFVFMGVGQGMGNLNVFEALSCADDDTETTVQLSDQDKLNEYLQTLEANPEDTTTMLAIATLYEDMYQAGEGEGTEYLKTAAAFMENAIDVDPSLKDVYIRLADIYMSDDFNNNEAAATVLNKAASIDPTNPEVFLKLGIAQQELGNKTAAVLAWQKYLELDPDGDMADVVKERLEVLTATTTTTTAAATTSTETSSTTTSGALGSTSSTESATESSAD